MRTTALLFCLMVTACVRDNAAFGPAGPQNASSGASPSSGEVGTTGDGETSTSTSTSTDPVTTLSDASTGDLAPTSTSNDPAGDTGDLPACEENGFELTVSGAPECGEGSRFFLRACVQLLPAGVVSEDRFIARTTPACGAMQDDCVDLDFVDVTIEASGHLIDELIDFAPLGDTPSCGSLFLEAVGDDDDDLTCSITNFVIFDPALTGPRFGFSNSFLSNQVQKELAAFDIGYAENDVGAADCVGADEMCTNEAGFRAIRFGNGPFAQPDGVPAFTSVPTVDENQNQVMRPLRVYNFGSRLNTDCSHDAKWAIIHDALPYEFQPSD
ncbi:MAG: hypothetical protein AAGA54_25325 [Myxococcota bacterium]